MVLRPYQIDAINAVYSHLQARTDNPCVVLPTAAGKTWVISTICADAVNKWSGRVLVLAHVKELLQQSVEKLELTDETISNKVGVYSAGLGRRDIEHPIIVAGIQSVYKRACELGAFDLIIIDEAHLIPPYGEGMYQAFLMDAKIINPNVRIVGLTATPFRMTTGMICAPENILNHVCYEIGVRQLIVNGYLCPLVSKAGAQLADTSALHIRGGEYLADEIATLMDQDFLVKSACDEILRYTADRKSCLIFASGVDHGQHLTELLPGASMVVGETSPTERAELLSQFKSGALKYLVNVNVLTTGFDAPNVDCVALVRPTLSPGLYYQMVGRGFRISPEKPNCLVLDFGGNIMRHGPVDAIEIYDRIGRAGGDAPAKTCPQCNTVCHAAFSICPDCGFVFPPKEKGKHDGFASEDDILSGPVKEIDVAIQGVLYSVHTKRNADENTPKTMRVDYEIDFRTTYSEWVCFEHSGFARGKAERWWCERIDDIEKHPIPSKAEDAVIIAASNYLKMPSKITVRLARSKKEFDRIVRFDWTQKKTESKVVLDYEPVSVRAELFSDEITYQEIIDE